MLVGFIGAPCSGKTTTAALAFAQLKQDGLSAEFVAEQARIHIARIRLACEVEEVPFSLDDSDQMEMMSAQWSLEDLFKQTSPESIIITDSCFLNALLYMSPKSRATPFVQDQLDILDDHYDLLFYCPPVPLPKTTDPNRVHSLEESLQVDKTIPDLIQELPHQLPLVLLSGDPTERARQVLAIVLEKHLGH